MLDYIHRTGTDALKGADILATAPDNYSSTVEYSNTVVGQYMKNIAQTHLADFGTRVLYTTSPYNSFDTHANQGQLHSGLWTDVSNTVENFFDDLHEHDAGENVIMMMFTEFGRRVRDNGSGTDHGSGGIAFVIGDAVKGGLYGEYPSLDADKLLEGDLHVNNDVRGLYATRLERWMGLDSKPIVGGAFEQLDFL